jgi:site-specific recombinase XerD
LTDIGKTLAAFEADLRAGRIRKGGNRSAVTAEHAALVMARIRRILDGTKSSRLTNLTLGAVNSFLDHSRIDNTIKSAQTRRHYERSVKSFTSWCRKTGRLPNNPLTGLEVTHVSEQDVVHCRDEFQLNEVSAIIKSATTQPVRSCLTGPQRALLYVFATATGFRARECGAVRAGDFAADFSFVVLAPNFCKNRKRVQQPVLYELRPRLMSYCLIGTYRFPLAERLGGSRRSLGAHGLSEGPGSWPLSRR